MSFFLPKINFKLGFLTGTKYTKGFTVKSKPLPALDPSHPVAIPIRESESHSVTSNSLQPHGLYSPWNSLSQNTGVGSLSFLQGRRIDAEIQQTPVAGVWHSCREASQ